MPDFELRDFVTAYPDFTSSANYKGQDMRALLALSKGRSEWKVLASGFARLITATPPVLAQFLSQPEIHGARPSTSELGIGMEKK